MKHLPTNPPSIPPLSVLILCNFLAACQVIKATQKSSDRTCRHNTRVKAIAIREKMKTLRVEVLIKRRNLCSGGGLTLMLSEYRE
jgi:hypothetical protein